MFSFELNSTPDVVGGHDTPGLTIDADVKALDAQVLDGTADIVDDGDVHGDELDARSEDGLLGEKAQPYQNRGTDEHRRRAKNGCH